MAIGLNFLKKVLETSCKSLYKFLDLLLETTNNNLQGRFKMSYSVVISFEIPNDLVFSNLSNERYDKEKEFINPIMEQAGEKMHVS